MTIEIVKLVLGPLSTNTYLIGDTGSASAVVIDPAGDAPLIQHTAQQRGWTIREILATHGHFDHIMAARELKELTNAPFRIHAQDLQAVKELPERVKWWIGLNVSKAPPPDSFIEEGDVITAGAIRLEVLFTPGHSPGHVSYVLRSERIVFSGDVLFRQGIGRYDLPGADYRTLIQSIIGRLLPLGDEFTVAPGHMNNTTIGYERAHNPYILDYLQGD